MKDNTPGLPVRGRAASQARSLATKQRIIEAATQIAGKEGLSKLTHRRVAERAGVPLAATTYYYEAKIDLVADVSNALLNGYAEAFRRAQARPIAGARDDFRGFFFRLLNRAVTTQKMSTVAWLEILIDPSRRRENAQLMRDWAEQLEGLWVDIAQSRGEPKPQFAARSGVDLAIGTLFVILGLGLSSEELAAVLESGEDPFVRWARPELHKNGASGAQVRTTPKAAATRKRILTATQQLLIEEGANAVSYRLVAKRAGLTSAAPSYHFSTPAALLREAQDELFEASKLRYRAAMTGVDFSEMTLEGLVDLTATVFLREATEFGSMNLASYGIWLEAVRSPDLQPRIWSVLWDQGRAWNRIFNVISPGADPLIGILIQAAYIGKLVRITCLGSTTPDLAYVRREFGDDLKGLLDGEHWLTPAR